MNIYFIGIGNDRNITINSSSQFHSQKPYKCCEIVRLLNEEIYKMKSIVQINTRLLNSIGEESEFSNENPFNRNILWYQRLKVI